MGLFGRSQRLSRSQLSRAASRAQAKGRYKKALRLYQELLEREPDNREVQKKIAGLQARTNAKADAWASFRFSAEAFLLEGFADKAIGVYREAAHYLPHEPEAWSAIADIHIDQDRRHDAVAVLREGRRQMRSRRLRAEAIRLLTRARDLEPSSFEVGFDLSRLYWKTGARSESIGLLEQLERVSTKPQLVRLRRTHFVRYPNVVTGWRWLRAAVLRR